MCTLKAGVTPSHPAGLLKLKTRVLHPCVSGLGSWRVQECEFSQLPFLCLASGGGSMNSLATLGLGEGVSTCARACFLVLAGQGKAWPGGPCCGQLQLCLLDQGPLKRNPGEAVACFLLFSKCQRQGQMKHVKNSKERNSVLRFQKNWRGKKGDCTDNQNAQQFRCGRLSQFQRTG